MMCRFLGDHESNIRLWLFSFSISDHNKANRQQAFSKTANRHEILFAAPCLDKSEVVALRSNLIRVRGLLFGKTHVNSLGW